MFGNQFKFSSVMKAPGYNDPVSAALSVGGSLVSGLMSSDAAQSAADTQAQTAANQAQLQQNIFNTQNAQLAPFRGTGYEALNRINSLLPGSYPIYDTSGNVTGTGTGTDYLTHQFNNADLNANLAPNYDWQLNQGKQATNAASNATGGLVGGNSLKALQDYTQNFAGNAYNQAFSNYNTQRGNIYNTLASIAGLGQTATNTGINAATNYGTNVANLATGGAAATAAGTVGSANALGGGIANAANMYSLSNILGGNNQTYGSGNTNAAGGISLIGGGGGNVVSNYNPSILES